MMSKSTKAKISEGLRGSRFDQTVYIYNVKTLDNILLSPYIIMNPM